MVLLCIEKSRKTKEVPPWDLLRAVLGEQSFIPEALWQCQSEAQERQSPLGKIITLR